MNATQTKDSKMKRLSLNYFLAGYVVACVSSRVENFDFTVFETPFSVIILIVFASGIFYHGGIK